MKKTSERLIRTILAAFALLALSYARASAMTVRDCSADQSSYGRTAARIACEQKVTLTRSDRSALFAASVQDKYTAVLVKTDGSDEDIASSGAVIAVAGPEHRYTLFFGSDDTAESAVRMLQTSTHIIYAELDGEIYAAEENGFVTSSAERHGFDLMLPYAEREGYGACMVAVVDSGIAEHSLIAGRVENGYDYVDRDDDPTNDGSGHGTHVAGIIADCTKGTSVMLYSVRVLDDKGSGTIMNTSNAVLEAADAGADIINLSMATKSRAPALDDAIGSAVEKGSVVVIASGNYGMDTSGVWPAHLTIPGVIVAGSVNYTDGVYSRASYSDYGDSVDVYACGTSIRSCSPDGGYTIKSGTSQAAPHVSAACALFKLLYGSMTPAAYEAKIKSAAVGDELPVLDISVLTPQDMGFDLEALTVQAGTSIMLPVTAYPYSCGEDITWTVWDENEIGIDDDGTLTAIGTTGTYVSASCRNFDDVTFEVVICGDDNRIITPQGLTEIGEQAFSGTAEDSLIFLHEGVADIAPDAFEPESGQVLVCPPDTAASGYALDSGLQYIICDNED